jgi:hypothetical protein
MRPSITHHALERKIDFISMFFYLGGERPARHLVAATVEQPSYQFGLSLAIRYRDKPCN